MKSLYDLISKLRNAGQSNQKFVFLTKSSFSLSFLKLLLNEGLIFRISELRSGKILKVYVKYTSSGTCSFKDIVLFSKFDKNFHMSYTDLTKVSQGAGTLVISTSKGLSTLPLCLKKRIGGVVLGYIS